MGGSSVSKGGAEEMDEAPDLTNNKRKAPPSELASGAGVSSPIAPPIQKRHEDESLSSFDEISRAKLRDPLRARNF